MSHSCNSKSALIVCLLIVVCATPVALAGASLDIRPSVCPNLINRDVRGILRVALVGDVDFVVSHVELASLELSRADGVGGGIAPRLGQRRPFLARLVDIAAPAVSGMCSTFGADGIRDLRVLFGQAAVVSRLELGALAPNATVEICLSGQTTDGTTFSACDHAIVTALSDLTSPEFRDIETFPLRQR